MWSSSGRPGVAAFPRDGRRWCGRGRRKRGGGRAARQRDQRGKRDVDLLHGPAGKHHLQQWVGRRRHLSCLVYSVTIPQTNSAPALQFSQLWPHICVRPCLCVRASSFQQLVGLQEAGLRPVLPRRSDRLPHCGSAPPLSRLLLGIHWHRSFCPPTGRHLITLVDLVCSLSCNVSCRKMVPRKEQRAAGFEWPVVCKLHFANICWKNNICL